MTVATYTPPNNTTQTATEYKAALDGGMAVHHRVAGAFAPHEAATPDMTVVVDAGAIMSGTTLTEKAQQATGTITAPVTNPRIDRIVIDSSTGVVSVIAGAEAASPVPPALTSGKLPIARVLLQTSSAAITNSMITDERIGSGAASGGFPSGTRMSFQQTAAPTGWTKDTTAALDDSVMRIVTGTAGSGGATAFSTFSGATATGETTLTVAQIPSHTHPSGAGISTRLRYNVSNYPSNEPDVGTATGATGGGGSHSHSVSQNLKYYDFIIASKD